MNKSKHGTKKVKNNNENKRKKQEEEEEEKEGEPEQEQEEEHSKFPRTRSQEVRRSRPDFGPETRLASHANWAVNMAHLDILFMIFLQHMLFNLPTLWSDLIPNTAPVYKDLDTPDTTQ